MNTTHNPGDLLHHNQYRIEEVLGMGGQGVVYRAHHFGLEASVAIKELFDPTPETRDHFRWQARTLLHLSHPALPRVMDFFEINQRAYLVMEYIAGEDLDRRVSQQGAQPVKQVLAWADTLLDALEYLHNQPQPIIHRDIKPANLKLSANGALYLVDFGLAKVGGLQKTTFTVAKGYTEGYAPPEQYGTARTDPRSDLYALGATLYYLLTAKIPPPATLRASGQVVPPINSLNRSVSPALATWIEKSMILLRNDRWPTTEAMRKAMPSAARAKMRSRHAAPPPMPNPLTTPLPQPLPTKPVTSPRRKSKKRPIPWLVISLLTLIGVLLLAFTVVAMNIITSDNPSRAEQATTTPPALTSTALPDNREEEASQEIASTSPQTVTLPSPTATTDATPTTEATATIEASTPTQEATHTVPAGAPTSTRRPTYTPAPTETPVPPTATAEVVLPTAISTQISRAPASPAVAASATPEQAIAVSVPEATNTPLPAPPTNTSLPLPTNTPLPPAATQTPQTTATTVPPTVVIPTVAPQPTATTPPPTVAIPTVAPQPTATTPPPTVAIPPTEPPPPPTFTPIPTSPPLPTNTPVPQAPASYDSGPNALEPVEGATIKSETVTFKWAWNGEALANGQQFRVMGFRDGEWLNLGTTVATQAQVWMPGFGNFETSWQWYVIVIDSAGNEISPTSAKLKFGISLSSGGGSSGGSSGGDDGGDSERPSPQE